MTSITVFSDYETYEMVDGSIIAIVTDDGMQEMENGSSFKHLADKQIKSEVSLRSLLDLWNITHGTNF